MPEGPEVKIIADQLNLLLSGKVLYKILVNEKAFPDFHAIVKKYLNVSNNKSKKYIKILSVHSKGKFLYIKLALYEDNELKAVRYLGNHLGLTGHWLTNKGKYNHVTIGYLDSEPRYVYYDDLRQFGDFLWLTKAELNKKLANLGPDILSNEFTKQLFMEILDNIKSKRPISSIIHDQKIFSGIGNYLRAEILYDAKVDPFKTVNTLTTAEKDRLYYSIVHISQIAYQSGGTNTGKYVDPTGKTGKFQPKVYQQKKAGDKIVKTAKVDGQTLYYIE